jgi:UDP-N-acetylmuramyl tripeptide synthase
MDFISVIVGKVIIWMLELVGKNGSALPGLIVEKTNRRFLANMLGQLPDGVVIISGTNGKTTTTKMVSSALVAHGKRVLTNKTGSNFVRGIISVVLRQASWDAKLPYDIAIIELDEAYAVKFVELHRPRGVLVLNVMRDQMDRFGEIDQTAELLSTVVGEATDFVVLNGDDRRVRGLAGKTKAEVLYFAADPSLQELFPQDDDLHGKQQVETSQQHIQTATAVLKKLDEGKMTIELDGEVHNLSLKAVGNHNALNATAAALVVHELVSDDALTMQALAETPAAFGRGEQVEYQGKQVFLQLVKNPAGFRQALRLVETMKPSRVLVAINDDYADGRDVSWLWDVPFETLSGVGVTGTSGVRAADMAVRLKYDDVLAQFTEPDLGKALGQIIGDADPARSVLVFCTYTAMLKLRETMGKKLGVTDEGN